MESIQETYPRGKYVIDTVYCICAELKDRANVNTKDSSRGMDVDIILKG